MNYLQLEKLIAIFENSNFEPVPDNKDKKIQAEKNSDENDEIEELKKFLEKKKIQNVALKKIMEKLNTDKKQTSNN